MTTGSGSDIYSNNHATYKYTGRDHNQGETMRLHPQRHGIYEHNHSDKYPGYNNFDEWDYSHTGSMYPYNMRPSNSERYDTRRNRLY